MISLFRRFAKSWVAALLIGLLVISFAIWGINDVFLGVNDSAVVKTGGRSMGAAQFAREFRAQKQQAEERVGQPITLEAAVERGFDRQVLERVAGREALAEFIQRLGLRVSDKQVVAEIQKIPAFFDGISGKFDQTAYLSKLAEKQFKAEEYERMIRDEIAINHVMAAMAAGFRAPRAYAAVGGAYALETRDLSFVVVDPRTVEQPKPPTDEELKAFMEQNRAQLTRPEMRQFTLVRFSTEAMKPTVTIDEAELQRRFAFRKDSLARPELRRVVQIAVKDAAAGRTVRQKLIAGASPEDAAKAVGAEPLLYADKPKTAIVDRKVADVAFSLKAGEVSEPIQGELGYAVVKVDRVIPGQEADIAQVRGELEEELRADAALEKAYDLTQTFEDAHLSGDSLADAAKKAGVAPQAIGPLTADGKRVKGEPVELPEQILKTVFDLPAGGESGIEEAGRGEYYAVKVDKVVPAAMPPLDEVKGQLSQVYMMRQFSERLKARAEELATRVRKGESLAAVAGGRVNEVEDLSLVTARKFQALGGDLLGKAFAAKRGDVFVASGQQFGFAVVKVGEITPPDAKAVAPLLDAQRRELTGEMFQGAQNALAEYARRETKTRTDLDLARQAIGIDPAAVPGAEAATAGTEK